MIRFACQNCGQRIKAPEEYAGKRVRCPKCKSPVTIPGTAEKEDSKGQQVIKFHCPICNQKIGAPAEYAGKRVRCSKCKNPLVVPGLEKEPLQKQAVAEQPPASKAYEPAGEEPLRIKSLSPEPPSTQPESFDSGTYAGSFPQTFRSGATSEPSKRKYTGILLAFMFVLAALVAGVAVWYFTADSGTTEGIFGAGQASSLDDTEDDGAEVALFPITNKNYKYGFIDNKGNVVIKPKYDSPALLVQSFSDGLARVAIGEKVFYINSRGKTKFVLDQKFHSAAGFSEGMAVVGCVVGDEERYGYIDKTGQLVIETKFTSADDFSEGLACVQVGGKAGGIIGGEYGYIDMNGVYLVEPKFDYAESFSEGLACVATGARRGGLFEDFGGKTGGKYAYIDKSGNYAIEPQFEWATSFSEGLAIVVIRQKTGFIDKSGQVVIEAKFDGALPFSEGLACVIVGDMKGYIDKTGKFVIEPKFRWAANSFHEGLAAVYDGEKKLFGFIDRTGNFVIEPQFGLTGDFTNGLSRVDMGPWWGYIDKTGRFVWKSKY
jgi:DNA-directed RNA polymerase subunit RPC12/RpoP